MSARCSISYFENAHQSAYTNRALAIAAIVSLIGASGVIVTLMEGFRRAFHLSAREWGFWDRRWRSFALVFIALVPLTVASVLVIFGHILSQWIAANIGASAVTAVLVIAFIVRWTVALSSSIAVIAVIYHMGIPPAGLAVVESEGRFEGPPLGVVPNRARDEHYGEVLEANPARRYSCHHYVVRHDASLRMVCHSLRQLFRGVRVPRSGRGSAVLAVTSSRSAFLRGRSSTHSSIPPIAISPGRRQIALLTTPSSQRTDIPG